MEDGREREEREDRERNREEQKRKGRDRRDREWVKQKREEWKSQEGGKEEPAHPTWFCGNLRVHSLPNCVSVVV